MQRTVAAFLPVSCSTVIFREVTEKKEEKKKLQHKTPRHHPEGEERQESRMNSQCQQQRHQIGVAGSLEIVPECANPATAGHRKANRAAFSGYRLWKFRENCFLSHASKETRLSCEREENYKRQKLCCRSALSRAVSDCDFCRSNSRVC